MSIQKINEYYKKITDAQLFSGSKKETSIRRYFANLLSDYAEQKKLRLVDEVKLKNLKKVPDGALVDRYKFVYGYWEAKDVQDDLEEEIIKKINIGYPTDNILFENSKTAILYQNHQRTITCDMADAKALHNIITQFVSFEKPEAQNFKIALKQFSDDTPDMVKILQDMIQKIVQNEQDNTSISNTDFIKQRTNFLETCKSYINPDIKYADIDEMIIQHILTQDIFKTVFSNDQMSEENNIAQSLNVIEKSFFKGELKANITARMRNYYHVLKTQATQLETASDRQDFLKTLYQDFYQAYNPKSADKMGIVYTPSKLVRFMIKTTDYLLEKHFDKNLIDENIHILDPATGTGTFITDLLDYMPNNNPEKFKQKYKNEIHANELGILPYYIAYLNIEYSYFEKIQQFHSFDNLCWVDTLDNTNALKYKNYMGNLFAGKINDENFTRIQKQNEREISVIMGNPPYNANQKNENDNNKNREYYDDKDRKKGGVDGRIKDTYIANSTAQKTKQYDMYKRFFRWASDRMNKDGIIAFVTNRAFIASAQDDGFRKCLKDEFNEIHIIDLKGDVRANDPKQGGNVFDIMTGVAISFLIRNKEREGCKIYYYNVGDYLSKQEKLDMLTDNELKNLTQQKISPDAKHNWIDLSISDFNTLIPLVNGENTFVEDDKKEIKTIKKQIFESSGIGVNTARDEWVFDFDKNNLYKKIEFFAEKYNEILKEHQKPLSQKINTKKQQLVDEPIIWDTSIKWSEGVKRNFLMNKKIIPDDNKIIPTNYRPFTKNWYYAEQLLSDRLTQNHYDIFGETLNQNNKLICVSVGERLSFSVLATNILPTFQFYVDPARYFSLYHHDKEGKRKDNITNWALGAFREQYIDTAIEKEDIFGYVYAVLHKEEYRKTYELDLKRESPRIPFYSDFWRYAKAGKALMDLHLSYDNKNFQGFKNLQGLEVERLPLETLLPKRKKTETDIFGNNESEQENKALLKKIKPEIKLKSIVNKNAVKGTGLIQIDVLTTITGIPAEAWDYRLGNRSAIDWVLDQYKPYKSQDKSIQVHFNNYDFADYKEQVIELLLNVIHISLETLKITKNL